MKQKSEADDSSTEEMSICRCLCRSVVAAPLMSPPRTRHVIVFTESCSDQLTRVMMNLWESDTWPCVNISLFKARPT